MYYMRRRATIFRDYGEFGYITDNRNYGYRLADEGENLIGDRIVSQSGKVFLAALDRLPKSLDRILEEITDVFKGISYEDIKDDAIEYYAILEQEGFVVSGSDYLSCLEGDHVFSYTQQIKSDPNDNKKSSEISEPDTQEYLDEHYYKGRVRLAHIHIEIAGLCNERCVHCYIPHENKTTAMDKYTVLEVLRQCRDMNVLNVTLSGGEPMLHSSFIEILQRCNEYNFSVNILSNLTILTDEIIREIKNNPLIGIQTSIYSMNPDIHDGITSVKGSLKSTIASVQKLIENDIPVQISCPIMKANMGSYKDVAEWGKRLGITVNADYVIIGRYDGSMSNLDCRLSLDDIKKYVSEMI